MAVAGLALATGWEVIRAGPPAAGSPVASRPAATGIPASLPASGPASQPRLVTQPEFMKVVRQSCLRCHPKACASVDTLRQQRWVVPGKPDASPAFTIIGKGKGAKTYHRLSEIDRSTVRDFIAQMKP